MLPLSVLIATAFSAYTLRTKPSLAQTGKNNKRYFKYSVSPAAGISTLNVNLESLLHEGVNYKFS